MKNPNFLSTNFIVAICLSLAGLTISSNVQAADIGKRFYIGVSFVPVSYRDYTSSDYRQNIETFKGVSGYDNEGIDQDTSSSGTLLTIGKELNEKWSVELGIKNYGENKATYTNSGTHPDDTNPDGTPVSISVSSAETVKITSTLIGIKYNFSPRKKLNPYGKIGVEKWKSENKLDEAENDSRFMIEPEPDRAEDGTKTEDGSKVALAVGIDFPTQFGVFQLELAPQTFKDKEGQEILSSDLTIGYHYKF